MPSDAKLCLGLIVFLIGLGLFFVFFCNPPEGTKLLSLLKVVTVVEILIMVILLICYIFILSLPLQSQLAKKRQVTKPPNQQD